MRQAKTAPPNQPPSYQVSILLALVAVYFGLGLVHLFFGRMTGDEGFFSLAARNVMEGMTPYHDFQFWQMPLLPYVYGLWFKLTGPAVESARFLSLLFGTACLGLTMITCFRRGGFPAALTAGILLALNLHYVFDTVTFKTQPLTLVLTAAGIFTLCSRKPGFSMVRIAFALAFISLAFLTRLSFLPAILLLWVYALWAGRRQWLAVSGLILLNAALLGAAVRYFWADGNLLFDVFKVHQVYFGNPPWTMQRLTEYFLRNWFAYESLVILGLIWAGIFIVIRFFRMGFRAALADQDMLLSLYLLGAYTGVTLIHIINVQCHPTHQTAILPFAVVLGAVEVNRFLASYDLPLRRFALVSLLLATILVIPSQEWVINLNGAGTIARINELSRAIKKVSRPGDMVLSFNAELAVNSGLKSAPGYDMSEFTYFPMMDETKANKLHVTNFNKLIDDISSGKYRIFCIGDRELMMMSGGQAKISEKIKQLINEKYVQVARVNDYGQFFNPMYVFVHKD